MKLVYRIIPILVFRNQIMRFIDQYIQFIKNISSGRIKPFHKFRKTIIGYHDFYDVLFTDSIYRFIFIKFRRITS